MAMLEINDLHVNYGMIAALKGISFEVNEGEVISLIGANGAGKTTTLHTLTGLISAKSGSIKFNGVELTKTPAHKIVEMGIAHVPEGRRIFQNLTVLDNLKLGAFTRKDKENIPKDIQDIYERFPRLAERKNQIAGTLSGGEQQMLAMGRALMSRPKIVVMDEPSMGLSPILVSTIFKIIEDIRKSGTTVLLVEQNAKKALAISDRAYVLETGKIVLSGKASDLINDESVKKAYLGESELSFMARIITIARGIGSGGRTVGKMLSEDMGIKYYDKELIKLASDESGINERFFGLVDEKLKGSFLRKGGVYKGELLDPDDHDFTSDRNLFNYQAKIIKQLADREPAVIVGRCADYILRDRKDVLKVFIYSDMETAVKNIVDLYGVSVKEAVKIIEKTDKERSDYYRHYTGRDWTNAKNYNLCLDTSDMSYDKCVDIIKGYIKLLEE